jgi:hypothetical protein
MLPLLCIAYAAIISGCAKSVSPASQKSIQQLHRNTAKATPREVSSNGQLILQYPWSLPDGAELILPLKSPLGVPTVDARLNEEPIPLIFDTGNTFPVLLDIQTAIKSGISTLKGSHAKGSGIGGNVNITIARFDSLHMRNTRVLGPGVAGVFLQSYQNTFAGIPVREIPLNLLGLPILERFSYVSFDGANETVRLGYKRAYSPKASALYIPFIRRDGRLWVDLWIGTLKIQAFFDSGCGTSLRIPKEILDSIPKNFVLNQSIKQSKAMGVGGVEVEDVGVLREAKLGNLKISPLEFDTTSSTTETLIGWGPFKNSRLTVDFIKNKIWFEKQQP